MGNPVVHFEISTRDPEALGQFYSEVFGWNTQKFSAPETGDYIIVDTAAGSGINGGIGGSGDEQSVRLYIEVSDLQAGLDKVESLGGRTVMPPADLGMVALAMFSDPEGNILGLVREPQGEAPGVSEGSNPPVAWFEVLGKDAAKLQDFYANAFDWKIKSSDAGNGVVYGECDTDSKGRGISGGVGSTPTGEGSVNFYVQVEDLQKYLDKAADRGGKTIMEPMEVGGNTKVAMFADPQGNSCGLFTITS